MIRHEPISGGYINFPIDGETHRIYYEQAGAGLPLLCLHTAGSDTRQYRQLLNDTRITSAFKVIAFDLPYHGKSSPPAGWHKQKYQLTSEQYINTILSFMDAMSIESPILMGCSIGGRVVLHMARSHPKKFKALIGLQSGAHVAPYYNQDWLHRPDVHGGENNAAIVSGLIGPHTPEHERWETLWHYMQSGPGVFKGDLYFYNNEGDLRTRVSEINSADCPLYFLTGEYDYSCTPQDTEQLVEWIPGSSMTIMKGMGHFPMSEDPERFIDYLLPILEDIQSKQEKTK